ncbi:DUF3352 domain-containing protein [Candidatus Poribacteria bacterium]|nr:DUF3352 domain-containing protein [Candidatus Poribacteria bacterium]
MIKKILLPLPLTALVLLTTLLFACLGIADTPLPPSETASSVVPEDSVLHLIPEQTLGLIYCPSLLDLDNRINALWTAFVPTQASDMSMEILSDTFGGQFEGLIALEEVFNVSQDFAVALTGLKPLQFAVLAQLKAPERIKQIIEKVTKADERTEYKDVTYWSDSEDNEYIAILGDVFVFSKHPEVCENVIDTYIRTRQAVAQNPDYLAFLSDILEDTDQLAVYFDVEGAIATLDRPLAEALELIMDNLEDDHEIFDVVFPFLEGISKNTASIEQVRHASLRLHIEGTGIQIKPFLKFKSDSEYLEVLAAASDELAFLGDLPNQAFMNAAFQGSPKFLTETGKLWFGFFPKDTPEKRAKRKALLEQTKDFYESLATRWSFSLNLGDPSLPVFIYELKDEQRAKTYMDEVFLEKLNYTEAYPGKSILHNRVEVKSYVFPNFKVDAPEGASETSDLVSPEWHWYYAFTEGQLLFTMGTDPTSMRRVLDRRAGRKEKFADHPSYQQLVDNLGTDNNVLLAISPITAVKTLTSLAENMDPNGEVPLQLLLGMFSTLPENYSAGFSAKTRDNGIAGNLFINLGDFKQLGHIFAIMGQMIQMP